MKKKKKKRKTQAPTLLWARDRATALFFSLSLYNCNNNLLVSLVQYLRQLRLISFLFYFKKKNRRSRHGSAHSHYTYSSVKLAQPISITSTPWMMLTMETVALFKSGNKHLDNMRRNQTYCPSQLLTKAVLESTQEAVPSKTALQTVWSLSYSAEYRQVGCC